MTMFFTPISAGSRQSHSFKSMRRVVFAVALSASLFTAAFSPYAHAATSNDGQPEGSHAWGRDGWCYVVTGGRWVRESYFRSHPDRNNVAVYDLYYNGQYVKRVDVSTPGWTKELTPAYSAVIGRGLLHVSDNTAPTEANLHFFVKRSIGV